MGNPDTKALGPECTKDTGIPPIVMHSSVYYGTAPVRCAVGDIVSTKSSEQEARIRSHTNGNVVIVKIILTRLPDNPSVVDAVETDILSTFPQHGPIIAVLDFSSVTEVSVAWLRRMLLLWKKIDASGGQATCINMCPDVSRMFASFGLQDFFRLTSADDPETYRNAPNTRA